LHLVTTLLILLIFSRALGQTLRRFFGQPEIVGEIAAGIILGPALLNWIPVTKELVGISELAVFLVIFYAGLEMGIKEVFTAMSGPGLMVAIGGFFTPLALGVGIGTLFDLNLYFALVLGLCLAITSLPVVLKLLDNMKLMGSMLSHHVIGATVIIDIVALLMLGIILDAPLETKKISQVFTSVGLNGLKMFLFFIVVLGVDWVITHKTKSNIVHYWLKVIEDRFGKEALFGTSVLFVLLFSSLTEAMGFHFIIGAFFGGMLLSREFVGKEIFEDVKDTLNSVTSGCLAPVFSSVRRPLTSPYCYFLS